MAQYRRPACLTCKNRRVKCDSLRPTCTRCRKACRSCIWKAEEETILAFKNENAFARGQPRRPRQQAARQPSEEAVVPADPSAVVSRALPMPLENHALNYFVENYINWPSGTPDISRDYFAYALADWDRTGPDSSLHTALTAFSLVIFGRARCVGRALEEAPKFYSKSIVEIRKDIRQLSDGVIDRLIVATMLMSNYENFVNGYNSKAQAKSRSATPGAAGSTLSMKAPHSEGTAALLQIRQSQGVSHHAPLYRAARRPIIRACIIQGTPVHEWLRDGAKYGEEGPNLQLDMIMVRVAALRSQALSLNLGDSSDAFSNDSNLANAALEAQCLDVELDMWSQSVPEDWKVSSHFYVSDPNQPGYAVLFDGTAYTYSTHGHAAVWIRYLAVRLIVNSICIQLLSQQPAIVVQVGNYQETIDSLSTDMCRSIPFFFDTGTPGELTNLPSMTREKISIAPRLAPSMSWPLLVAVSISSAPVEQKAWLRDMLRVAAAAQGDSSLKLVAEMEDFIL